MKRFLWTVALAALSWTALGASTWDSLEALALKELTWEQLAALDGEALMLNVDRDAQQMTVNTFNRSQVLGSTAPAVASYTVAVTTQVVRNQDVSPSLSKDAMTNTAASIKPLNVKQENVTYNATQFPTGSASLTGTNYVNSTFGTSIRTSATQTLTNSQGKTFVDTGYSIHYTPFSNTQGCIGVKSQADMNRLLATYTTNGGDRFVTVSAYGSR